MVIPLAHGPWRGARWLVLAPHPDDETLGAGALIAEAASAGRLAAVLYLTDGKGSHPDGGRRLAQLRRREARLALHRLGASAVPIVHLDWPDAAPWPDDSPAFARSRSRLAAMLRHARIDAIAVTAAQEPHCDHAAAHRLAAAAAKVAHRPVALFEYVVWAGPPASADARRYRTGTIPPGRRRHALRSHRSQLGPAFGAGFRLDEARLRMADHDILYRRTDHAGR